MRASEFRSFLKTHNVVGVAVAVTSGATVAVLTNSLVSDIVLPLLQFSFFQKDENELYSSAPLNDIFAIPSNSKSIKSYPLLNLTGFYRALLYTFFVTMFLFVLLNVYNKRVLIPLAQAEGISDFKKQKCKFCLSSINYLATRCPHCTSELRPAIENVPVDVDTTLNTLVDLIDISPEM
ncbi:hypothetical protein HK096_007761 [Nowakowskiella sp. JEL0078]|nr:hypothetical protein HK096_007761 [Nowakowskiella sp. JEL0078]